MNCFSAFISTDPDPLVYSFTPEIEHVTLIAAVRLEMASDWARLRRAAMRIGSPVVQLANIEGDGISDCRPLVLNDYSSFVRAWNSIDYVFGDPDYAWLATVSGEGPALIGSTKQDAIASVVREWGDARSNAIDLLDAWQGPGPRPSTLWIQPLLERVLGKRLAAELLLAHGTWLQDKGPTR